MQAESDRVAIWEAEVGRSLVPGNLRLAGAIRLYFEREEKGGEEERRGAARCPILRNLNLFPRIHMVGGKN